MLARTPMKTAEELGVSDKFYNGLVKLLLLLRSGKLPGEMNMGFVLRLRHSCGTVGCIMGWAALLGHVSISNMGVIAEDINGNTCSREQEMNISRLVTPAYWTKNPYTAEEIMNALETFLYTGVPKWPDVYDRVGDKIEA